MVFSFWCIGFTGVIAVLFFLTCALKYTCQQKCPLLYSKVQKVSFCCTFLLLSCTFHQDLDWDKQNIQSQLQKIVKNFPVPIVENSFDCWELPWQEFWWQFPLLNFHGNSFKLSIFDVERQICVLFLYNLYFFAKSIDVL